MAFSRRRSWKGLIRRSYATRESPKVVPIFHPPASREAVDECAKRLNVVFPDELRSLLFQTNGVSERVSTRAGEIDSGYFLFSVERIMEINTFQRTEIGDYTMPLDSLLFFAEDGIGDYFGFAVVGGRVPHSRIYFWNHEDDSRIAVAPSLEYFIVNWLLGKIRV